MSWPSPEDYRDNPKRLRRRKWEIPYEEQKRQVLASQARQEKPPDPRLVTIVEFMRGDAFGAWYEATTGGNANQWVDDVLACIEILRTSNPLELIRQSVLDVIRNNRWTNPEARALWTVDISSKTPSERRRILLRLATPRWANIDAIVEIYMERARLTRETGIEHHVDHIVPIVNARACGLHCEQNLRVIPATVNCSKSNSFTG